jgi:hypothetical protein
MKNKKKINIKENPKQNIRRELQNVLVRIISDSNMTRTFMIKATTPRCFNN